MTPPSGDLSSESIQPKIQDIKPMVLQGPDRNYTLVKIIADDGIYGIGEGYGSPGVGVKEQVEASSRRSSERIRWKSTRSIPGWAHARTVRRTR